MIRLTAWVKRWLKFTNCRNRQLPALSLQVPNLGNLLPEQIKFRRNPLLDRQLIQS